MIRRFCRRHREGIQFTLIVFLGVVGAVLVAGYAIAIGVAPWTS